MFHAVFKWFLMGLILSLVSVGLVRAIARRCEWVVSPRHDRWHQRPTAIHGGVGMMMAWLPLAWFTLLREGASLASMSLLGGCIGMWLLGLFDDLYHYRPAKKLVGQLIGAGLLIGQGVVMQVFPWHSANVLLTFIWFVGIINAVNMMDNMDGLAAGVVAIGSVVVLVLLVLGGGMHTAAVPLVAAFIGVLIGFLVYNFNPASIFMGDSGSMFIGYFLATISLPNVVNHFWFRDSMVSAPSWSLLPLLAPAMILAVPIFDATLVTILRKQHGRLASQGGKDHSSHRLVGLGLSERKAVLVLYSVAVVGGAISIFSYLIPQYLWSLFTLFGVGLSLFGIYLGRLKIYDDAPRVSSWTPLVTQILYKRQFAEVLMDLVFIVIAYQASFLLLFEGNLAEYHQFNASTLPWVVIVMVSVFWCSGYYRSIWRLIGLADFGRYFRGVMWGTIILGCGYRLTNLAQLKWWPSLPRHHIGLLITFSVAALILVVGSRLSFRYFDHWFGRARIRGTGKAIMIYGAGHSGKIAIEELKNNPLYRAQYHVICFLDDDQQKHGRLLQGIPIYCPAEKMAEEQVEEIWVTAGQISDDQVRALMGQAKGQPIIRRLHVATEMIVSDALYPARMEQCL